MIQVKMPDGNMAQFPDDMSPEQIQSVLQNQFPAKSAGQYTELTQAPETVSPEQFTEAPAPKEQPDFMKKLEMIGSGAMQGTLEFTGRLLSRAEQSFLDIGASVDVLSGKKPQPDKASVVPGAYDYWQEKNQADQETFAGAGGYQLAGQLPAEILTTAPVGGLLGAATKGAQAVGKALPYGLKTIGKYGTSALAGGGILSAMESQRFDPENPSAPYSAEQFQQALSSPVSYLAPMAGTRLATWADKAQKLEKAKEIIPRIRARDLKESGAARKIDQIIFDSIPNLTGFGKGVRMQENIGDDLYKYINRLSGNLAAKYSKDYKKIAGQEFKRSLEKLKAGETKMWDKPFKTQKLSGAQDIKDDAIEAADLLRGTGIPLESRRIKTINNLLRKDQFTVDDVKNIQSKISKAAVDAKQMGAEGQELGDELFRIKDRLMDKIQSNISPEAMKDFTAARTYTSNLHKTLEQSPKIRSALYDELDARNLIKSVMSEAEAVDKAKTLGLMSDTGKKATFAAKLARAVEESSEAGKINLNSFINKTAEYTQTPDLMGDTYQAIKGLNRTLSAIQEAGQQQLSRPLATLGALGAGTAVATGVGTLPVAGAAATYAVLASIANRSPLKTTLSLIGKGLDKTGKKYSESMYKYLIDKAGSQLTRFGYFLTDGVLDRTE